MATDMGATLPSLRFTYRIGVTGHRWVAAGDPGVQQAAQESWQRLCARILPFHDEQLIPRVVAVTCLAEGADRIIAALALSKGANIEVILPLPAEEYERDFASEASRQEFRSLLSQASAVTVAATGGNREEAYARAGALLVARSDVLIGMWDQVEARGKGGTASIIASATASGMPLDIIHVRTQDVAGSARPHETRNGDTEEAPVSQPVYRELARYNRPVWRWLRQEALIDTSDDPLAAVIAGHYIRADVWARTYRLRLTWAGRALFFLSFVAVLCVATQLVFAESEGWLAWLEFSVLMLLLLVLLVAHAGKFTERWAACRYLAERLRASAFLSMSGLPPMTIERTRRTSSADPSQEFAQRALREICYSADWDLHRVKDFERTRATVLGRWLEPQIRYHQRLHETAHRNHVWLVWVGLTLFGVSVLAALLHATHSVTSPPILGWLNEEGQPEIAAFVSLIVPAAGAAIAGYGALRGPALTARRSAEMEQRLTRVHADLVEAVNVQQLQELVSKADLVMQGESADWYSTASVQRLEV